MRGWTARAAAIVALLGAAAACSRDPRQALVRLNVPYTADAWVQQAGAGDTAAVRAFLASGMDANARDTDGHTPLMNAAAGGHEEIVRTLLASGAQVNVTSPRGMTPLAAAILNDHAPTAMLLIDGGAALDAETVNRSPLLLAIRAGRPQHVRQLLDKGAHAYIQDDQWSALMMASFLGNIEIVSALLGKDSNIDAANDDGVTALMFAASAGHTDVVRALLTKGAAVDGADAGGVTALMLSSNNGHAATAQALVDAGANAAARSRTGATAKSLASANGHAPVTAPPDVPAAVVPVLKAEQADRQSSAAWRERERAHFTDPGDRQLFDAAARGAWAYVERHYQAATGLVDATAGYRYTTVWDVASGIAALYSGHALGLLDDAEYDRRIRRVLTTLQTMAMVDDAAFNKVYSTRTAGMVGPDTRPSAVGYGWSTTDVGRLLVWLHVLATTQPAYAADAAAIVKRLDFTRLVADGYMWGEEFDADGTSRRYQEGEIGYEQYAARGFAAWGAPVDRALGFEENGLPITVMGRALYADARGGDRLTSDPILLMGLEVGWDAPMERFARNLLGAQEARYRQTGRVTLVAEDAVGRPPHFFYYYSVYTQRRAFGVDVQRPGAFVDTPRWVSAKAAFGWHALLPRPYTRLAIETVTPAMTAGGWGSGVFEGTRTSTRSLNVNTAAVILTAALFEQRGEPLLSASR